MPPDTSFPKADPAIVDVFEQLVAAALEYRYSTGRHLSIFGEPGELYAEIAYGIARHALHAQGSDGRLGNDFVEVKTISPEKKTGRVQIKRGGHFSKLVVVRISDDYEFESRMINRRDLKRGKGKFASVSWNSMAASPDESDA